MVSRKLVNRRRMIQLLGGLGCGMTLAPAGKAADGHAHGNSTGERMQPVSGIHAHFCGIHKGKKNAQFQIVTQHYCSARTEEMHQCLLYDSCESNAKLLGVEYIISDRLYRELPADEKPFWHPHTYEVLAGGLVAPEMDADEETKFMKALLNTWGKTWHTWPDPQTQVPMGEPVLIWSATGDGQIKEDLVAARDREFGVSTAQIRARRTREFGLQVPQVSPPKSVSQVGRQWTDAGPDIPRRI